MLRRTTIGWFATGLLGIALTSACGTEQDEIETARGAATVPRFTYLKGGSFTPTATQKSMVLTDAPLTTTACFLTGFHGRLRNTDTSLQMVFLSDHSDGNYWVVGTSGESLEKTIQWACVAGITTNQYATYSWSTNQRDPFSPADMGPASDRVCFLNKIEGWFNGSGEEVRVRVADGRWLIDGKMGTAHYYAVGAGATCIKGAAEDERSGEYSLTSPSGGGSASRNLPYDAHDGYGDDADVCGLTRLGGKWGDGTIATRQAHVRTDADAPSGSWQMLASSAGSQVSVGARCAIGSAFVVNFF